MITKLKKEDYKTVTKLLPGLTNHPVIFGVIGGNNPGEIFVDDYSNPKTAFIWAKNEMFYLCGNVENEIFNASLEKYIATTIRYEALQNGEEAFNLEVYPTHEWNGSINQIFNRVQLFQGERVPFIFHHDRFAQAKPAAIADGYEVKRITPKLVNEDPNRTIEREIKTFWGPNLELFFQKGIGFAAVQVPIVIGTCISVFIMKKEYEIGINTYHQDHRGKGLASAMAHAFIKECLDRGGNPHWTTESFRKDSIAIALKMGFEKLPNYPVYYLPFQDFIIE